MSKGDYIYLNRSLLINDLWKDEPFTRGQAWVDLLMLANWRSGIATLKGEKVPYERGQLCRAMKQLAVRWKWSEGKVKRYLELLKDLEQITFENWPKNGAQKRYVTTLITITNYSIYQADGAPTERERSADGAPTERERSGGKKEEEGKEKNTSTATRSELAFLAVFEAKESRIKEKFPHADYEAEKETCIAHYRSKPPPIDPYQLITKWFQRVPKIKTVTNNQQTKGRSRDFEERFLTGD